MGALCYKAPIVHCSLDSLLERNCYILGHDMTYHDVDLWVRVQDLISNRVSIVNQCLGARYEGVSDNPCVLRYSDGFYSVVIYGAVFVRWRLYDQTSTDAALSRIDAFADGLWLAMRSGKLAIV